MLDLPPELILDIAIILDDPADILRLSTTSRYIASVARQPTTFQQHLRIHAWGVRASAFPYPSEVPLIELWLHVARVACACHEVKRHLEDFTRFEDEFLSDDRSSLQRILANLVYILKDAGLQVSLFSSYAPKIASFASSFWLDFEEPETLWNRTLVLASCAPFVEDWGHPFGVAIETRRSAHKLVMAIESYNYNNIYTISNLLYFELLACLRNSKVRSLLPRGFDWFKFSMALVKGNVFDSARCGSPWKTGGSATAYGFYSYFSGWRIPHAEEHEEPMVITWTTKPSSNEISGSGSDTYGPFSLLGQTTDDGAYFVKSYPTYSFNYRGSFTPWGLVGQWFDLGEPADACGEFYIWKAGT